MCHRGTLLANLRVIIEQKTSLISNIRDNCQISQFVLKNKRTIATFLTSHYFPVVFNCVHINRKSSVEIMETVDSKVTNAMELYDAVALSYNRDWAQL